MIKSSPETPSKVKHRCHCEVLDETFKNLDASVLRGSGLKEEAAARHCSQLVRVVSLMKHPLFFTFFVMELLCFCMRCRMSSLAQALVSSFQELLIEFFGI